MTVNGNTVTELGTKADPETDDIRVDGRRVKTPARRRYILLYKPRGYITSRSDPEQRPTVIDLLRKGGVREYVYPVGRLDYESEGLLLLTSDGDLAERLMHPQPRRRPRVPRPRARRPDEQALDAARAGIVLDGRGRRRREVEMHKVIDSERRRQAILSMVIHEGRNRQVRRMCEAVGHPVSRLQRVRIGPITDEHIRPGEFRDLSDAEVAALKRKRRLDRRPAAEPQRTPAQDRAYFGEQAPPERIRFQTARAAAERSTSAWVISGVASCATRPPRARSVSASSADSTAGMTLSSVPCSR